MKKIRTLFLTGLIAALTAVSAAPVEELTLHHKQTWAQSWIPWRQQPKVQKEWETNYLIKLEKQDERQRYEVKEIKTRRLALIRRFQQIVGKDPKYSKEYFLEQKKSLDAMILQKLGARKAILEAQIQELRKINKKM